MTRYRFDDGDIEEGDSRFLLAAAHAHQSHRRAYCLCREPFPEMYVAHVNGTYLVKRMPNSGERHAVTCASYAAPASLSGLGELIGDAIEVRPEEGCTMLRLDFPLSRKRADAGMVAPAEGAPSLAVRARRSRLSLRALLHYLWAEAGLHRWYPAMASKRNWYVVRKYLLRAVEDKRIRTQGLAELLYVPEVFRAGDSAALRQRRQTLFQQGREQASGSRQLLLAIGDLKAIDASRRGFKLTLKHAPDCPFLLQESLEARLRRRYAHEFDLWTGFDDIHLVACFTFSIRESGLASVEELCLMAVTGEWLPCARCDERTLLNTLVAHDRAFESCLRYNLPDDRQLPIALLLDGAEPYALHIVPQSKVDGQTPIAAQDVEHGYRSWVWAASADPMPALPPIRHSFPSAR